MWIATSRFWASKRLGNGGSTGSGRLAYAGGGEGCTWDGASRVRFVPDSAEASVVDCSALLRGQVIRATDRAQSVSARCPSTLSTKPTASAPSSLTTFPLLPASSTGWPSPAPRKCELIVHHKDCPPLINNPAVKNQMIAGNPLVIQQVKHINRNDSSLLSLTPGLPSSSDPSCVSTGPLASQPLNPKNAKMESEKAVKEEARLEAQRNTDNRSIHPTTVTAPGSDPKSVPWLWLF
ncbi:hypothetical protein PCASD_16544 [Puccinia coronata f. sp. avenae]|uniref:Uncharacterized protein n=1 Tax=Puccinia coronata f. sp. avenae TaxID=200324 RepID=A0A2N5U2R5_9BASI|nr:hypothetical protein PCASD_16544 [Puccinia coronata f. sp. avenae]